MSQGQRRLAAIMFTDMVGYTALGQKNEALSLALVEEHRKVVRPVLARHNGREVKTIGDAFLVDFPDALDAVRCAYDIQRAIREFNYSLSEDSKVHLRVGIHLGDVVESVGDIGGDAVNVASRIEPLADDGGVCLSSQVYDAVHNKFELPFRSLGTRALKNVTLPVEVFAMVMPWEERRGAAQLDQGRVAVLPFANMSPDPGDEYFADGLTEELIDRLCQVRELEVIARTSVMSYKKKEKKVAEIARELGAGSIVEGSVRKAGNSIRVTAQLINGSTEGHLWSSRYDRKLDDIFAVQTDIAEQVTGALKVQLLPGEKKAIEQKRTENMEAYALYLKGRFYYNERNPETMRKAMTYFETAIAKDPGFALAHVDLANCYQVLDDQGAMDPEEANTKAMPHLEIALGMSDGQSEAHASLAVFKFHRWEWAGAEAEFREAIRLNLNNASAHHWYSILLAVLERKQEALDEIRTAQRLDPASPVINANEALRLAEAGYVEESIDHYRKLLELEPNFWIAYAQLGGILIGVARFDEAITEINRAIEIQKSNTWPRTLLCYAYGISGDRENALKTLTELEELSKTSFVPDAYLGLSYYAVGDKEKAYSLLKRASGKRSSALPYIRRFPAYNAVRKDERIRAILDKPFT